MVLNGPLGQSATQAVVISLFNEVCSFSLSLKRLSDLLSFVLEKKLERALAWLRCYIMCETFEAAL